jgi:hypothetical protein
MLGLTLFSIIPSFWLLGIVSYDRSRTVQSEAQVKNRIITTVFCRTNITVL